MPFCPKCKYEYEFGVSTCPDCEEKLVASLPEENIDEQPLSLDDWVPLARLSSYQSIEMVIEALRSNDIPVVPLSGMGHFGVTSLMGTSAVAALGGGYTLMVPEDNVVEADQVGFMILGQEWASARLVDIDEAPEE